MKDTLFKFLLFTGLFFTILTQSYANTKPKILILHSYHPTLKWTKDLNDGIHAIFPDITKVDLYTEYMDTKHHSSKEYRESLTEVYYKKYKNIEFDVIICSDNNAFDFLKLHHTELFQDTPVVFSGVNDFQDEWIEGHENFTGVSETVSYLKNFLLMQKLQPQLKNIYIITDETVTAKADKKMIETSIQTYPNKNIKFTFISAKNLQSLLTNISNLPENSAILYSSYYQESTGKSLKYHTVLKQLTDISDAPVYIVVDQYLGHGTIGGYVKTGFLQGEKAAQMATLIIQGAKASKIPVLKDNQNQYMFDYDILEKQNIDIKITPSNSVYINKPNSILELYFKEIVTVIILFIMMLIFIIILLIINKKRAKAEQLAKKQLIFQQSLIDNVNTPIYYKNTNREYIGCNKAFAELMNIEQNNIINKTTSYLNEEETAKFIDDKDIELLNTLEPQEYEGIYKLKDGTLKDFVFYKNIFFEEGQVGGIVGSIFDITEIKSLNHNLNSLLSTFDTNVIASKIDSNGKISYVSQALIDISKYKKSELIGQDYNILGVNTTESSIYDELWSTISKHRIWSGELVNKNQKGEEYTLYTIITPEYNKNGDFLNFTSISQDITAQKRVEQANQEIEILNEDIVSTQREIIYKLGAVAEARSKETGLHVRRVAMYSEMFALYYGLSEKEAQILKMASPMHDIGKIAIPDAILNKPARFTEEEFEIMKTHAKLGYDMLKDSNKEILKAAAIIAHEHQEKYDGSGYPQSLKGDDIHIYGRITAIADVFDALGSPRVYKKAWEDEKVFQLLKDESGKHFDPKLVDIFFTNIDEFLKVRDKMKDII